MIVPLSPRRQRWCRRTNSAMFASRQGALDRPILDPSRAMPTRRASGPALRLECAGHSLRVRRIHAPQEPRCLEAAMPRVPCSCEPPRAARSSSHEACQAAEPQLVRSGARRTAPAGNPFRRGPKISRSARPGRAPRCRSCPTRDGHARVRGRAHSAVVNPRALCAACTVIRELRPRHRPWPRRSRR
jgi:hypothetical protein